MKTHVLVFDFGNVLGMFSHYKAASQISFFTSHQLETIRNTLFESATEDLLEKGLLSPEEFRSSMREKLALDCSDAQFDEAFSDMFSPNLHVCRLIPKLAKNHRLLLLSNTNWFHARKFKDQFSETLRHFEHLILSHEVGCRKPSNMIYETLNQRTNTLPGDCIFIDDLLSNIQAAESCGWKGILYGPNISLEENLLNHKVILEA
jgi:HAD superfamily hydrolase (TIGR01509 family)